MQFDGIDHDSIWCNEPIQDILGRRHNDPKSAEASLTLLRNSLLNHACPPEVNFLMFNETKKERRGKKKRVVVNVIPSS